MKEDYRETSSGRNVKYDHDPANDYSDGYNAGRRYEPTPEPPRKSNKWLWWLVALLLLIPLILFLLGAIWPNDSNTNSKNTPSPAPAPAATASPAAPVQSPGTLPAVGSY